MDVKNLQAFAADAAPLLETLELAASRSRARFPTDDYIIGYGMKQSHLEPLLNVAEVLRFLGEASLIEGNAIAATDRLVDILHASNVLAAEPFLLSQIIRMNIHRVSFESL